MYLADFVTVEGDRFFVSVDTQTGKFRIERVSDPAFERFIRNVLCLPNEPQAQHGSEVAA